MLLSRLAFCLAVGVTLVGCADVPPPAPPAAQLQVPADLLQLAQMSLDQGNYEDAQRRFGRLLEAQPNNKDAKLGLAEAILGHGDHGAAKPLFEALAEEPTTRPRALLGMGLCALAGHDFDAAEPLLTQAVEADAGQWRGWNALGRIHDTRRQWEQSASAYAKAQALVPDSPVVNNNMGYSLLLQGRHDKAIPHFVAALDVAPKMEAARNNLRIALASQGRYDDAQANTSPDKLAMVLNNLGYVAMSRGDLVKAESLLSQAIETSPNYYDTAWRNLGRLKALHPEQK